MIYWSQRQDVGPAPRSGSAMAYHSVRERVVLMGGAMGVVFDGGTWEWDGERWTQVADTGPSGRAAHTMTFDAARQRVVLFGGTGLLGELGDTWTWDGAQWTQVEDSGPAARANAAMAYDPVRARVVLFGGGSAAPAATFGDTWEWDGTAWTQVDNSGPGARTGHTLAFDGVHRAALLYGGQHQTNVFGDTWAWDGQGWTQLAHFGPANRTVAAMAGAGGPVVLFGGLVGVQPNLVPAGDTWQWDGVHWTQVQDIGPRARCDHAVAADTKRSVVVLFGGNSGAGLLGDTWEVPIVVAPVQPPPPPLQLHSFQADRQGLFINQQIVLDVSLNQGTTQPVAIPIHRGGPAGPLFVTLQVPANAAAVHQEVAADGVQSGDTLVAVFGAQTMSATVQ